MEPNRPKTLEELIHRELAKLTDHQAPASLVPHVLARIQTQAHRHWWQRPWNQWPFALQAISMPVLLLSAVFLMSALDMLWTLLPSGLGTIPLSEHLISLAMVWEVVATLGNALLILIQSTGTLWLMLALSIPLAMYLACVGLGTVCYRLAFSKR
jgi:hypothetical protein